MRAYTFIMYPYTYAASGFYFGLTSSLALLRSTASALHASPRTYVSAAQVVASVYEIIYFIIINIIMLYAHVYAYTHVRE